MDTTANLLTTLRNAEMAGHATTSAPTTKMNLAVLYILHNNGIIKSYKEQEDNTISITLTGTAHTYKRISKLGRRLYTSAKNIQLVQGGLGIVILSTSQGLLTGRDARKAGLGGEIVCEVY